MPSFSVSGGPKAVMVISSSAPSSGNYTLSLSDVSGQRKFSACIVPDNLSGKLVGTLVLADGNYDFSQNAKSGSGNSTVGFFKSDGSYVAAGSVVIQNDAT